MNPTTSSHSNARNGASAAPRGAGASSARGEKATEITRLAVGVINAASGRGPTSARSFVTRDVISIVLGDALTRLECTLRDGGHEETVKMVRAAIYRIVEPQLISGIESLTGSTVLSAHADHRIDTDTAVLTFVLAPSA